MFLFSKAVRPVLRRKQLLMQWAPGELSSGLKRPRPEAGRLSTSSAVVNNDWTYTSIEPYIFTRVLEQIRFYLRQDT